MADLEREENRHEDLAIPLFELEQRTEKLEHELQTMLINLPT